MAPINRALALYIGIHGSILGELVAPPLRYIQKEAYFAKIPCITLDTVSAWPETVEDGWNIVVGEETDRQQLRRENIINAVKSFEPNKKQQNIFGNGKAAEKICDLLVC